MKDTLYLPLKAEWYEMIEAGVKTEEYREIKPYWIRRLCSFRHLDPAQAEEECKNSDCTLCYNRAGGEYTCYPFRYVQFSYGYTKRTMTFEVKSIRTGYGKPEWGAPQDREVFIIELGRRVK